MDPHAIFIHSLSHPDPKMNSFWCHIQQMLLAQGLKTLDQTFRPSVQLQESGHLIYKYSQNRLKNLYK